MNHPLSEDFSLLSDADLQEKLADLSSKYWKTQNPSVQSQMLLIIEELKEESRLRASKVDINNSGQDGDNSLDNLINIS